MSMPGTPMEHQKPLDVFELVRLIATTRIALPRAKVRLSAGRTRLSKEAQAMCFFAGANSIFYGEKLLTAANPGVDADRALLAELDLTPQEAFQGEHGPHEHEACAKSEHSGTPMACLT
jgi:biotin synthase